jgi:hypothetical protein
MRQEAKWSVYLNAIVWISNNRNINYATDEAFAIALKTELVNMVAHLHDMPVASVSADLENLYKGKLPECPLPVSVRVGKSNLELAS